MNKLLALSAASLIGVSALAVDTAEARSRRGAAVAAGVIGGLAAGALIGAATSGAYANPGYSYGYGYPAYDPAPAAYGYGAPVYDEEAYEAPVARVPTRRAVREYGYDGYGAPLATGSVRAVRGYDNGYAPVSTGYRWGGPVFQGYTYEYGQ